MIFLIVITLIFAALRFIVPVSGEVNQADVFKDLAHIWVGVLFGCAITVTRYKVFEVYYYGLRWKLWSLAIGLTVVEVIAFFVRVK